MPIESIKSNESLKIIEYIKTDFMFLYHAGSAKTILACLHRMSILDTSQCMPSTLLQNSFQCLLGTYVLIFGKKNSGFKQLILCLWNWKKKSKDVFF